LIVESFAYNKRQPCYLCYRCIRHIC